MAQITIYERPGKSNVLVIVTGQGPAGGAYTIPAGTAGLEDKKDYYISVDGVRKDALYTYVKDFDQLREKLEKPSSGGE